MSNKNSWGKQTQNEDYTIGQRTYQRPVNRTPGVPPSRAEINDLLNRLIDANIQRQTEGGDNNGGSESKE